MHRILFYNKFIIRLYMFRALCAHHQDVKIVLYSIWYHHTCRWPSGAQVERDSSWIVAVHSYVNIGRPAGFVMPDGCITLIQFHLGVLLLIYLLCLFSSQILMFCWPCISV